MWWRDESGYDMRLHCSHKFYYQWLKYIKTIWKISERSRKRCNLLMHFSFLARCRTLKNLLQFTFFINEHLPILNNFFFIRVFFSISFILYVFLSPSPVRFVHVSCSICDDQFKVWIRFIVNRVCFDGEKSIWAVSIFRWTFSSKI